MREQYGWWFPTYETHFPRMLEKSVDKGSPPVYQEGARKRSIQLCRQRRVALDVGANVGLWGRDLCEAFDHVIAFEPVNDFRQCLIKNVKSDRLEVRSVALGNENTRAVMTITEGNSGHSHIDPNSFGSGDTEVITLDSLSLPVVDYIKIDCEGFEYRVLQGAEQTIRRCRPIVVIEQKPHAAYSRDYGQFAAVELLQGWGMTRLDQVRDDWIMGWQ
jgi:FkbM family methyltransferase